MDIELCGDLGGLLGLAIEGDQGSDLDDQITDYVLCSLKLVAGVGFEPTTFRL